MQVSGREAADARVDEMWEWGADTGDLPGGWRPRHEQPPWLIDLPSADLHLTVRRRDEPTGTIPR
jgi:hypothetical protein